MCLVVAAVFKTVETLSGFGGFDSFPLRHRLILVLFLFNIGWSAATKPARIISVLVSLLDLGEISFYRFSRC